MKRIMMLAVTALAAFSLAGCVQMYSDTNIDNDGSGTASFSMALSPGMAEAIDEMKELGMDQDQGQDIPEFDKINREDLEKSIAGHGVKITKFEKDNADGNMSLALEMEFEDLKGLSYAMGKIMGGEPGDGMGIFATDDGNFVLKQARYDFPPEPDEEIEETDTGADDPAEGAEPALTEEEKAQKQMALMGKMMGAMAELDVKFTITVPGEVIESNAPTVEGNTSIWAINASNMMSQQETDLDPVITFSGKGLKIKPLEE